jgi:hypothetical protein
MSIPFQPEDDPVSNKFITVIMLTSLLRKKINISKKSLSLLVKKWYDIHICDRNIIKIELKKFKKDILNFHQNGIKYPSLSMFPEMEKIIDKIVIEIENINSKH